MKWLKNAKSLLLVTVLLVILLITALSQIYPGDLKSGERKKISLIVYGDDSERWENLRQGAGLVCDENSADLSLITMLSESDVEEQKDIIRREIESGADALMIAACNSSEISRFVDEIKVRVPVVFLESLEEDDAKNKVINTDDYKMGYELGESIVENESDIVTVAIISENTERDSISLREKGIRDAIAGKVGRVLDWSRNESEKDSKLRMFIQKALVSEATDVIVTLDNSTTDALLDALVNLNKQSKVYSISTSNQAVYNLYGGEIRALEYQNEYSMGYLAAMYALDGSSARKKFRDKKIDHRLVKKENMYDEENQSLLFPFVN